MSLFGMIALTLVMPFVLDAKESTFAVSFKAPKNFYIGQYSDSIAGDFDGDGIDDLVFTNIFYDPNPGDSIRLALGKDNLDRPSGSLKIVTVLPGYSGRCPVAADFNLDGKLDLAFIHVSASPLGGDTSDITTICVLLGHGDGTFSRPTEYSLASKLTIADALHVAHLNHGSFLDLVVHCIVLDKAADTGFRGALNLLLGVDAGAFQLAIERGGTGAYDHLAIGDLNGDGLDDIVSVNSGAGRLVVYSNGDGTFRSDSLAARPFTLQAVIGDFNGDGRNDIVSFNGESDGEIFAGDVVGWTIEFGKGDGTFQPAQPLAFPFNSFPGPITVCDWDQDGKLDLIISGETQNPTARGIEGIALMYGNGDGSFSAPEYLPAGNRYSPGLCIGDFNGDGFKDLKVNPRSSPIVDSTTILFGRENRTFGDALHLPEFVTVAITADLNQDGHLDLVSARNGQYVSDTVVSAVASTVSIRLGNGDGTFKPAQVLNLPLPFVVMSTITAQDLDHDGKLDLAVTGTDPTGANHFIAVAYGNGDGTYQPGWRLTDLTALPQPDELPDYPAYAYLFQPPGDPSKETRGYGDFNNDLFLDVVEIAPFTPPPSVGPAVDFHYGDAAGGVLPIVSKQVLPFDLPPTAVPYSSAGNLVVADLDGDQLPDVVAGLAVHFTVPDPGDTSGTVFKSTSQSYLMRSGDETSAYIGRPVVLPDEAPDLLSDFSSHTLTAGGFVGDGKTELLKYDQTRNRLAVISGHDDWRSFSTKSFSVATFPSSLLVGDFNEDGLDDIAVAGNGIDILLNDSKSQVIHNPDKLVPLVNAKVSPQPNINGWNKESVVVTLAGLDRIGGTGIQDITYTTTGALATGPRTVSGTFVSVPIAAEGKTQISFFARSLAGGIGRVAHITVGIDRASVQVSGSVPVTDGLWHANNVSTWMTTSDALSGTYCDTSLVGTKVPINTENANAWLQGAIFDLAGNSTKVGGWGGFKIDRKAPTIAMVLPAEGGVYTVGQKVSYTARDGGSGLASVVGDLANGTRLTEVGKFKMSATAADKVGNIARQSVNYAVQYALQAEAPPTKPRQLGRPVLFKIRVVDIKGENLASKDMAITAVQVYGPGKSGIVPKDVRNATVLNPNLFRYNKENREYSYKLDTTGYPVGQFVFHLVVGSEVIGHDIPFELVAVSKNCGKEDEE